MFGTHRTATRATRERKCLYSASGELGHRNCLSPFRGTLACSDVMHGMQNIRCVIAIPACVADADQMCSRITKPYLCLNASRATYVAVRSPYNRRMDTRTSLLLNVAHRVDCDNQIASSASKASDGANACALITGYTFICRPAWALEHWSSMLVLLPLPLGEGWGEGLCAQHKAQGSPHPSPLPGGRGDRKRCH